jgi:hypothetical protein
VKNLDLLRATTRRCSRRPSGSGCSGFGSAGSARGRGLGGAAAARGRLRDRDPEQPARARDPRRQLPGPAGAHAVAAAALRAAGPALGVAADAGLPAHALRSSPGDRARTTVRPALEADPRDGVPCSAAVPARPTSSVSPLRPPAPGRTDARVRRPARLCRCVRSPLPVLRILHVRRQADERPDPRGRRRAVRPHGPREAACARRATSCACENDGLARAAGRQRSSPPTSSSPI